MPRRKQLSPMQRIDSGEIMHVVADTPQKRAAYMNGSTNGSIASVLMQKDLSPQRAAPRRPQTSRQTQAGPMTMLMCAGGIYASFLTWGLLQERITTTPYQPQQSLLQLKDKQPTEYFKYSIFINTIQALFAFITGSIYLYSSTRQYKLIPTTSALAPLALVSVTQTLASPFGYASLAHVDYLTFVLAKSCKLLPVMALHITLFNKRYPLSKYLIVLAVTAGVAVFTLYHPPKASKPSRGPPKSSYYGLSLLAINLLFDGLTNTVQDHLFASPDRYGVLRGPQIMVSSNLLSLLLQLSYLLLTPLIPLSLLPTSVSSLLAPATTELSGALAFISRHPAVLNDVLGFCVAGAIGQLFIFATLQRFGSLALVTITVTRKMLTMVLSVVWYGKSLTSMQWGGVALVFGGVAAEAWSEQSAKRRRLNVARGKAQ